MLKEEKEEEVVHLRLKMCCDNEFVMLIIGFEKASTGFWM